MPATAVILAAGLGRRMNSTIPKALHKLAGRPMLNHLITSCEQAFDRIVVVIGPGMAALETAAAPHRCVVQAEQLGTAHAALQAAGEFGDGEVAVLYADNPLISPGTLRRLLERRRTGDAGLALLAMRPADPAKYGRVVTRDGFVERIVEYAEASEDERAIGLCNAGVLCAAAADMRDWLDAVPNDNADGEFYLTSVVELARTAERRVVVVEAPEAELRGINSRLELAEAEASIQQALRRRAMASGVTMTAPETVFLAADTALAHDVTIGPNVVFGPRVNVAAGAEIRAFCHLEGCTIGAGAIIGPFARLRPGTTIGTGAHVGNFVELKAAVLGDGAKANHLAYLGDATIGAGSNIGAGTITCNYDGFAKHRTEIGYHAFIGSNATLVAPLTIGHGAIVTAGSTITADVPEQAMAFGRARQETKPDRARAFRAARRVNKE